MDHRGVRGGTPVTDPLDDVYARRFPDREAKVKAAIWRPITRYLQRYIDSTAPVLDIASDRGYFINHVVASERWASDVRDMSASLDPAVQFVKASGLTLGVTLPAAHFGTIFMSNYLEHLRSADDVIAQFKVVTGLLAPGGRVIVLQPNIRFVGGSYWDFIDHRVALTERSLVEAAELGGLRTVELIPRFLPFATGRALPSSPTLVRLYLALPLAWRILGKQTLYVGERA